MARLSEEEKREWRRLIQQGPAITRGFRAGAERVKKRPITPQEYVEFATFAARFGRGKKPVRFGGAHWKL